MFRRFVEAPVAPSAIVTVPVAIVWLCDVVLVKVAYVPRPAMLAAAPSSATVASSFGVIPARVLGARRTLFLSFRIEFFSSPRVQVETLPAPPIDPAGPALYPQLLSNRATFDVVETRASTIV